MSIIEIDQLDAMGLSKDGKGLKLILADHLDWENETEHISLLQRKINVYLSFIESNQYSDTYPGIEFEYYVIEVRLKYEVTEKCLAFYEVINTQLREYNIQIVYQSSGNKSFRGNWKWKNSKKVSFRNNIVEDI